MSFTYWDNHSGKSKDQLLALDSAKTIMSSLPQDMQDILHVQIYNMPIKGRPENTKFIYLDAAKGWNYLRAGVWDMLLEYVRINAAQLHLMFKLLTDYYGRDQMYSVSHTWSFLAKEANLPSELAAC